MLNVSFLVKLIEEMVIDNWVPTEVELDDYGVEYIRFYPDKDSPPEEGLFEVFTTEYDPVKLSAYLAEITPNKLLALLKDYQQMSNIIDGLPVDYEDLIIYYS